MDLDSALIDPIIDSALREDKGDGDRTTESVLGRDGRARARIVARQTAVIAGLDLVERTFRRLDPECGSVREVEEGSRVGPGRTVIRLAAEAAALLTGERTALNFLQHLSGIATRTAEYVDACGGRPVLLLDTRKTTPGLRHLEKYAVRVGGARNHRLGLFDGILIKENHQVLAGGVGAAVRRARESKRGAMPIHVEVRTLAEYDEAVRAGADLILLDNLPPEAVREAVRRRPAGLPLEASGGITPENVGAYAETGVNRISAGGLTHSATWADFSMEVDGWEAG